MKKIKAVLCVTLYAMLFSTIISGCGRAYGQQSADAPFSSYRDIPGVTGEQIAEIERLRETVDYFVYGMLHSTESFYNSDGEIDGFAVLVCRWLTELFGIPFIPRNYTWTALLDGLEEKTIDFTGYLMPTESRRRTYRMTDPIAQRMVKYFRLRGSPSVSEIRRERPPIYALVEDAATTHNVLKFAVNDFEYVLIEQYTDAYELLLSGEVDALVTVGVNETGFGNDVMTENFIPPLFASTSFATQNPELEPFVAVMQMALENGALRYLNELYRQGEREYGKHVLFSLLNEEQLDFIRDNPVIPFAAEFDNYPVSFFDTSVNEWQGIAFDVLSEIEALTGLKFEVAHDKDTQWAELLRMLEDGEVYIISELIRTTERENRFLWAGREFYTDYSALVTEADFPYVSIHEVVSMKVGLIKGHAHTDLFWRWFPDHRNVVEYDTTYADLEALTSGEVDMVMNNNSILLL